MKNRINGIWRVAVLLLAAACTTKLWMTSTPSVPTDNEDWEYARLIEDNSYDVPSFAWARGDAIVGEKWTSNLFECVMAIDRERPMDDLERLELLLNRKKTDFLTEMYTVPSDVFQAAGNRGWEYIDKLSQSSDTTVYLFKRRAGYNKRHPPSTAPPGPGM